ncbi:hypothetical protein J5N97_009108 [Dioscorea zingiberensis]|uniref:Uncharacterized protein n=1 Tax=Dioscorea zingiberensis TaxID=325984 RepID=A0A9D5HLH3_9LILI|nr:hypothetical protein J5N97_009108 [Dioscorea zingiberensis]
MGGENSRGRILMRAMQLSQSRAREAEKRAVMASEMVVRESVKLCAYKHWVEMLEIRVLVLEKEKRSLSEVEPCGVSLCFVLALCFGVAGMGFMIGRCLL